MPLKFGLIKGIGRLSLNVKLLLGFGVSFLVTLLLGLAGLAAIHKLSLTTQELYQQDLLGISHFRAAQVNLVVVGRSLRRLAMSVSASDRSDANQQIAKAQAELGHEMALGRQLAVRDSVRMALPAIDAALASYASSVAQVQTLLAPGDAQAFAAARQLLNGTDYGGRLQAADAALDAIVQLKEAGARESALQSALLAQRMRWMSVTLLVLGLAFGVASGWLVTNSIRGPMLDLGHCIVDLAEGQLDGEVPHCEDLNEIGEMARSVRVLQQGARLLAEQRWIQQSLSEIEQAVLTTQSYSAFSQQMCSRMAPLLNLLHAALYVPDADQAGLQFVGGYGCDEASQRLHVAWGQGLVGQVAQDRSASSLALDARSGVALGLGTVLPAQVLAAPVFDRGELLAVLELGLLQPLTAGQSGLLQALLATIGVRLSVLAGRETRTGEGASAPDQAPVPALAD